MYFDAEIDGLLDLLLYLEFGATGWRAFFGLLTVIGFFFMFRKSGVKRFWAFVPFARTYMIAKCADREEEGRVSSIITFILFVINALGRDDIEYYLKYRTAKVTQKSAYEFSEENILSMWVSFAMFILFFAALSIICLEFIDRDKR